MSIDDLNECRDEVQRARGCVVTTVRQSFPNELCADCGHKGCTVHHSGSAVPAGVSAYFCQTCWNRRYMYRFELHEAMPLGYNPADPKPPE